MNKPHTLQRFHSGFTLIELMITVAILAITMSIAAPGFRELLTAQRMRSVAYDMTSSLVLARSEAVKRGLNVNIEPNASGWQAGWTVRVPSTADIVTSRNAAGNGVVFTTSPGTVTFDLNGRLSSASTVVRFEITDGATRSRCISLDPSGRPKSVVTACPS
ncbi:MAG: GspH/FimT family pseudopilin [Bdellovibrionales bacterium]|nr:GspH/FimT family pseudopilin [Ramlibacter sp.]